MSETTETMRRHAFDYGIGSGAELEFIHDADRLAKLEDGIRALEKKYGEYSPADRVSSIHFYRELRALLND